LRNVYSKYGEDVILFAFRAKGSASTISRDLTTEENIDFTAKYPLRTYTYLKEALSQSPDVAFICNPTSLHISLSLAAAKAGWVENSHGNKRGNG
jgi:predicted dehydrogenase